MARVPQRLDDGIYQPGQALALAVITLEYAGTPACVRRACAHLIREGRLQSLPRGPVGPGIYVRAVPGHTPRSSTLTGLRGRPFMSSAMVLSTPAPRQPYAKSLEVPHPVSNTVTSDFTVRGCSVALPPDTVPTAVPEASFGGRETETAGVYAADGDGGLRP
ncbi:GntR family transcriptional regulator [Streptomyces sp. H27-H1]|uniref:GntR family transcriptional regulator n=1 Tax=Streptomyces sp. H27-H1 TaxID=2996461 RepID=UPI00226D8BE2|nr:GntR family transcriptional regulator [Streptomyces sp. H27-H1]MCY0932109.1 GntR family transcriptional regulator [Streptomyces sp. H27-H1]